ncbi:MAG: xanthine phosphoribosyltransferase [Clostridiales bacterium]|nr:xanthine phosphoribosyltransferase [Clostridiales bacterium]MDD6872209.1 xanthine phosphoribosyltransferase [Clostridiales bacterium]
MKLLEERILRDGVALNSDVLLVDSFLNNQVDTSLMGEVGRAFAEAARDLRIDRVVTIESSGIAPAQMTAIALGVPLVILKKSASRILKDDVLQTEVFSFTKNSAYQLTLRPKYVRKGERVLLIDDFLARGEAACGAARLIEAAGAQVAAIGIVIEKAFQPGRALLDGKGYRVISLARVSKMGEGNIEFTQADA